MDYRDAFAEMDVALLDALGDDAVVDGVAMRGLFEAPWIGPELGALKTAVQEPRLTARSDELAAVTKGSRVTHRNVDYDVVNVQPDGAGMTTLILRARPSG